MTYPEFDAAFARMPLVAVLRGIRPDEAEGVGAALVEAGFAILEVTMNSPDPLDSIARLARLIGDRAVVGAGTVLVPEEVDQVRDAGGALIVSPDCNPAVIARAAALGLPALPGVSTPTEAFVALRAGAAALKLFPAEGSNPGVLKAMRAVLPKSARVLPVGGITPDAMPAWTAAGADGFGLGSALYVTGRTAAETGANARAFTEAWRRARR